MLGFIRKKRQGGNRDKTYQASVIAILKVVELSIVEYKEEKLLGWGEYWREIAQKSGGKGEIGGGGLSSWATMSSVENRDAVVKGLLPCLAPASGFAARWMEYYVIERCSRG